MKSNILKLFDFATTKSFPSPTQWCYVCFPFVFFKTINIGKTIYFLGLIHSSCRGFDLIYLVSIHLNFYHILFLLWIRWEIPENKK